MSPMDEVKKLRQEAMKQIDILQEDVRVLRTNFDREIAKLAKKLKVKLQEDSAEAAEKKR